MISDRVSRVLVVDGSPGQNRSALATVRALSEAGYSPCVTISARRSLASSSRHAAGQVRVPHAHEAGFYESVRTLTERGEFAATIVTSDAAISALGLPEAELIDKSRLEQLVRDVGLPVPTGRRFDDDDALRAAAADLDYPVVVKPVVKQRALAPPARVVRRPSELTAGPRRAAGPLIVQTWIDEPLRAVSGVMHEGRMLAWVHQRYVRTWPRDAGVSCFAVTVDPDRGLEDRLQQLLQRHTGVFQVQLAGDHVLDVNPRVYGSLPLAVAAGANLPAIHCRALLDGEASQLHRARIGVHYRWVEGDVRHVLGAVRAGDVGAMGAWEALRPRRGTVHSVLRLDDPGPVFARLAHTVSHLFRDADRRG